MTDASFHARLQRIEQKRGGTEGDLSPAEPRATGRPAPKAAASQTLSPVKIGLMFMAVFVVAMIAFSIPFILPMISG